VRVVINTEEDTRFSTNGTSGYLPKPCRPVRSPDIQPPRSHGAASEEDSVQDHQAPHASSKGLSSSNLDMPCPASVVHV
jgi:hypothetical protein